MRRPALYALLALVTCVPVAFAHPLSPSLLAITEQPDGMFAIAWKTPILRLPGVDLRPVLPADCTPTRPATTEDAADSVTARWTVDCGATGLVGREIAIEGLNTRATDVMLSITLANGRSLQSVLRAREPTFTVPADERTIDVIRRFLLLGAEHIATGFDHLLFVFGLLLLVAGPRQLIATVTAFTLGHSMTLALATLDLSPLPVGPIEVLIAASIYVLAVELARGATPSPSLMQRSPWLMALVFGLLHGLGFAGALRNAGLPAEAIPLALVSFNVGIELGQLAFVVGVVAFTRLAAPVLRTLPTWASAIPIYAMGSLAAFWTFERIADFVGR